MGLAASQGRYLCLTARNSDLVYEAQQISQQRMALANQTQLVAKEYNEAMSNTVMKAILPNQDAQRLTYDLLTNQDPNTGLCMRVVDLNGNVVVPGEYIEVTHPAESEDEKPITYKITSSAEFIKRYLPDIDGELALDLGLKSLEQISAYYKENYPDSAYQLKVVDKSNMNIVGTKDNITTDPYCTDPDYLQDMLTSGQYLLQQSAPNEQWEDFVWQGSSSISEEYDTTDDAVAEAKYESAMIEIQKKDKLLELRLEQVQTEQSAVEKEMDSVKEVISKNIENGFKTFA